MVFPDDQQEDADADAILAELEAEEDEDVSSLQEQRASQLRAAFNAQPIASVRQDVCLTLKSDDDALQFTTEHEKAVVHFFHPQFARCSIMDDHLNIIAQKHADYGTESKDGLMFGRVDVAHAEFVVEKLGIRVLPCVIGFDKGQVKGRIIGFEGVSWGGKEKGLTVTRAIEERFVDWTLLKRPLVKQMDNDVSEDEEEQSIYTSRKGIRGPGRKTDEEDDDWY